MFRFSQVMVPTVGNRATRNKAKRRHHELMLVDLGRHHAKKHAIRSIYSSFNGVSFFLYRKTTLVSQISTDVYVSNKAPIGTKLCQNAFQTIPDVSFFDAGKFFSATFSDGNFGFLLIWRGF